MLTKQSMAGAFSVLFRVVMVLALFMASGMVITPVHAAGLVVNSNVDDTLVNLDANATCDLREAITNANANAASYTDCASGSGSDTITFAANYSITLTDQLPPITSVIIINGNGVANTIIQANAVSETATYRIFAVVSGGSLTIDSLTVQNGNCIISCYGFGDSGGGILNDSGTLIVTNSAFIDNAADYYGGGIYNNMSGGYTSIRNTTFAGNTTDQVGGAIANLSNMEVSNSTFWDNTTTNISGEGGGIYNSSAGNLAVLNSTFSGNTAPYGGGIYNSNGSLVLKNTILANNGSSDCYNYSGDIISDEANNLIESNPASHTCGTPAVTTDPGLLSSTPQDNGGPTKTFAIDASSPAYNAGDTTTCNSVPVSGMDQRGVARPQGVQCDIGSYEYETPSLIVTNNNDSGAGSLRAAVILANAAAGPDTIHFDNNYTITLNSPLPNISGNLTIDGEANAIVIDGDDDIMTEIVLGATASFKNLIIQNCNGTNGGILLNRGTLSVTNSTFRDNTANGGSGGAFYNYQGTLTITDSTFSNNSSAGGGALFNESGTLIITDSIFEGNSAANGDNVGTGGAILSNGASGGVTVTNSTFNNNSANFAGGAINSNASMLNITNTTFSDNTARNGGAIRNASTANITNSTFSGNSATVSIGGGIYNFSGTLTVTNSTLSGNTSAISFGGDGIYNEVGATLNLINTIIANSTNQDCFNTGTMGTEKNNLIEKTGVAACGLTHGANGDIIGFDPLLGTLAYHGGDTKSFALLAGSSAIDAGDDASCVAAPVNNLDQRGFSRPIGTHCDIGSYELDSALIDVIIGGNPQGSYGLLPGSSQRVNYAGLDSGPVKVVSTNNVPIIAAIRDAWAVNGVTTSFSQLMGLPLGQVSDKYVFPAYNNVTLNEQLRIGNVNATNVPTTVTVTIGGVLQGTYTLEQNEAIRINYAGLDSGPVVVDGTDGVDIIAAIRDAWAVNGVTKSFVQLMGLPASQLSNKYVFPAYNNVTLNEQLRIGNVNATNVPSTVNVTIGGVLQGTYTLQQNEAIRINYAGLDSGPVVVEGTPGVNIIAAIRDAWAVNGVTTSFSQLMGMPASGLSNTYIFPAYNNVTLNEQLRIGNVNATNVPTTVSVTIGGVLQGTYTLQQNEAIRINYAGLDSGPVVVQGTSGVKIIAAIREAWAVNGVTQSFVQLMGLPFEQLSATYLFPAYNNVTLNEQLRFAVP